MDADGPRLRVVSPDATPDEVAAIIAAVTTVMNRTESVTEEPTRGSRWVQVSRRSAVRVPATRSEWRFSGRTGGRARA